MTDDETGDRTRRGFVRVLVGGALAAAILAAPPTRAEPPPLVLRLDPQTTYRTSYTAGGAHDQAMAPVTSGRTGDPVVMLPPRSVTTITADPPQPGPTAPQ